ncbi:unnamed protein product [Peniophora sp. CBMAI 1063]|nr:unnamed protein product [Peniophora sp. CBMAI 1063]
MPALRVRVESAPPLPPLKAWLPLNEDQHETVMDLQAELCMRLNTKYSAIVLTLDGYELIASSPVRDVIRDGELIVIRSSVKPLKRLAEPEPERPRKRAKLLPKAASLTFEAIPAASSSSSSSSSSSDSSDSTSDDSSLDSDSSSDADSDSDSDSTSSSDSGPSTLPTTKSAAQVRKQVTKPLPSAAKALKSQQTTPHIPPGHGKASTQSRNARRRKKREFERVAQSAPIAGASAANSTPLGVHSHNTESAPPFASELPTATNGMDVDGTVYPDANSDQPDMLSFSNKNKRRGFKRAMADIPPQRITFHDETALAQVAGPSSTPLRPSASRPTSPTKPPRLIPPSEKAALGMLPPGMIVTSVDVEAGMWPTKNFDKKRKKKQRDAWGTEEHAQHSQEYIPAGRQSASQEDDWSGALPYGDGEHGGGVAEFMKILGGALGHGEKEVKEEMLDWADLETRFDAAHPVSQESLKAGSLVAWKEFGVHPVRLTPEMVVHAAMVESVDTATGKVAIRSARREATFGALEEEGEPEIAEYELSALGQLGWKSM